MINCFVDFRFASDLDLRCYIKVIGKLERAERAGVNLDGVFSDLETDLAGMGLATERGGEDTEAAVARADAALGSSGTSGTSGSRIATPDVESEAAAAPSSSAAAAAAEAAVTLPSSSPPPPPMLSSSPLPLPSYPHGVIVLRLLRNWGSSRAVGLDGIELFAADGTRILPPPGAVSLKWLDDDNEDGGGGGGGGRGGLGQGKGFAGLFNGRPSGSAKSADRDVSGRPSGSAKSAARDGPWTAGASTRPLLSST